MRAIALGAFVTGIHSHVSPHPWAVGEPHGSFHGVLMQVSSHPTPLYQAGVAITDRDDILCVKIEKPMLLFGEAMRHAESVAIKEDLLTRDKQFMSIIAKMPKHVAKFYYEQRLVILFSHHR